MTDNVPLIVPPVNADHIELVRKQVRIIAGINYPKVEIYDGAANFRQKRWLHCDQLQLCKYSLGAWGLRSHRGFILPIISSCRL